MKNTAVAVPEEQHFILSGLAPGPIQLRLAFVLVSALIGGFVLITFGPLASVRLQKIDSFVPVYATAMFACDSITAILLYAQFSILRSRAVLVIASGYLFTALILIPWVMVFPGFFVSTGGLMGGPQSTSWLWFTQHAGFSLFVLAYALIKDADSGTRTWHGTVRSAIVRSVAFAVTLVVVATLIVVAGADYLPHVVLTSLRLSPLWIYFGIPVGLTSVLALCVLWVRRRSSLDLWLMVVMFIYTLEISLSYYPLPERHSLAWYTVRVFAIVASSLVLVVLLYEIEALYARLVGAMLAQRREREARRMTGDTVAAAIAHEIKQPLTAMVTSANAGFRFLDRSTPNFDKAKEAFKRVVADGRRAGAMVDGIRANFKNDDQGRSLLDVNELIRHALALEYGDLRKHGILVQAEPDSGLPEVQGNRVQLQQVLLNLITNAIDAMAARDQPRVLLVKTAPHGGDEVVISVADTGPGIGAQDAERIFNPLFTTKSDGMGMGLSICRAIVEAHHGRLWVTQNAPRGALFQFTLRSSNPTSAAAW
jgi:signal transduction histidine kinase